jgi:hypothetical protein
MNRIVATVLFALVLGGGAAAQEIGGLYDVQGTNFNGSPYSGQAKITITSNTTCEIEWITGGTSSKGFCMRNSDAFSAAYIMGKDIGLIIYKAKPDGSLEGVWTIRGQNGAGTETLTPKN